MAAFGQLEHSVEGTTHKWTLNDVLHREDGPALYQVLADGSYLYEAWFFHGEKHRIGAPAYSHRNGLRLWYEHNLQHRVGGPSTDTTGPGFGPNGPHIGPHGYKIWKQRGQYHRVDGPAFERANGSEEWFQNDQHHREDGPAIEKSNGDKEWWVNGERTRSDGHAIEYADPNTPDRYFWNGIQLDDYDAMIEITGQNIKG